MSNRAVLTEGLRLREPECERRPPAKQMTPVSTVLVQQLIILFTSAHQDKTCVF